MSPPFTPTILRFDSLPSTNTEAARQASLGAREGLCVVAREQTAGRGRRERAWVSPKDAGLYLSVVLRPALDAREWPLVSLAETLETKRGRAVVLGIGVNLRRGSFPEEIRDTATSVEEQTGRAPDAERLLQALTRSL